MEKRGFHRNTRQRGVILDELRKSCNHPTAAELYKLVREKLPRISLGTVYRNLEMLTEHGIIRKLEQGGSRARYDGDLSHHYHIRCAGCGRLEDIQVLSPISDDLAFATPTGYEVIGYRIEFTGLCRECRENRRQHDRRAPACDRKKEQGDMRAGKSR